MTAFILPWRFFNNQYQNLTSETKVLQVKQQVFQVIIFMN